MGMNIETTPGAGFLTVAVTGDFSLPEAQRTFVDVVKAVAEYNCENVVVDGRKIDGQPETIERFYYGEFAAKMCQKHLYSGGQHRIVPRFAYILREPILDPERFRKTVARNRGTMVKVFEDFPDAYRWPGLPAPGDPHAGEP